MDVDLYYRSLDISKIIAEDPSIDIELGEVFDCLIDRLLDELNEDEYVAWCGITEEGVNWTIVLVTYIQPTLQNASIEVGDYDTRIVWEVADDADSEIF